MNGLGIILYKKSDGIFAKSDGQRYNVCIKK